MYKHYTYIYVLYIINTYIIFFVIRYIFSSCSRNIPFVSLNFIYTYVSVSFPFVLYFKCGLPT